MRTYTASELTAITSPAGELKMKFTILRGGVEIDITNRIKSISISDSISQRQAAMEVTLDNQDKALSPLNKTAAYNLVGGSYSPLIWPCRHCKVRVGVCAHGHDWIDSDYKYLFHGILGDDISINASEQTISLQVRDQMKSLQDYFELVAHTFPASPSGGYAENIIQEILNHFFPGVWTLACPTPSQFFIPQGNAYGNPENGGSNILEMVESVSKQIAWVFRFKYKESITSGNVATFTRATVAYDRNTGAQVSSGVPRYESTGVLLEEACTNLLAANQASVETDLTGINGWQTTRLRVTTQAWHGSASVEATLTGTSGAVSVTKSLSTPVVGTLYNVSAWVKGTAGKTIKISCRMSGGVNAYVDTMSSVVTCNGNWQRISSNAPVDYNDRTTVELHVFGMGSIGDKFYIDGMQIEQKAYTTSWQLPGASRNNETVTIPTTGIIKGNLQIDFDYTPTSIVGLTSSYNNLFLMSIDTNNYYNVAFNPTGKIYAQAKSGGSYFGATASSFTVVMGTKYHITAKFDGTYVWLYINGVYQSKTVYTEPVGSLPATITFGSNGQANGLYKDIQIGVCIPESEIAAEWATYGALGQPYLTRSNSLNHWLLGGDLSSVVNKSEFVPYFYEKNIYQNVSDFNFDETVDILTHENLAISDADIRNHIYVWICDNSNSLPDDPIEEWDDVSIGLYGERKMGIEFGGEGSLISSKMQARRLAKNVLADAKDLHGTDKFVFNGLYWFLEVGDIITVPDVWARSDSTDLFLIEQITFQFEPGTYRATTEVHARIWTPYSAAGNVTPNAFGAITCTLNKMKDVSNHWHFLHKDKVVWQYPVLSFSAPLNADSYELWTRQVQARKADGTIDAAYALLDWECVKSVNISGNPTDSISGLDTNASVVKLTRTIDYEYKIVAISSKENGYARRESSVFTYTIPYATYECP